MAVVSGEGVHGHDGTDVAGVVAEENAGEGREGAHQICLSAAGSTIVPRHSKNIGRDGGTDLDGDGRLDALKGQRAVQDGLAPDGVLHRDGGASSLTNARDGRWWTVSVTGHFIRPGLLDVPFVYKVTPLRDGRSYCARTVTATQSSTDDICFTCTVSLQTPEASLLDVQAPYDLGTKYRSVLSGKRPADFPPCPGMDTPAYVQRRASTSPHDAFPGLDTRKVDMHAYNAARHPLERRQLVFYRALGLPLSSTSTTTTTSAAADDDDPNLHLCAHLYASDRNSLFHVVRHFDVADLWTAMGSLSHAVVFHAPLAALLFRPCPPSSSANPHTAADGWFVKEDAGARLAAGRGLYVGRAYAPDGTHVKGCMPMAPAAAVGLWPPGCGGRWSSHARIRSVDGVSRIGVPRVSVVCIGRAKKERRWNDWNGCGGVLLSGGGKTAWDCIGLHQCHVGERLRCSSKRDERIGRYKEHVSKRTRGRKRGYLEKAKLVWGRGRIAS
nr:hypothetical protein CFP56_02986 [Quercus suber]